MARPEIEPKTPLGRRLREVRAHFRIDDREEFAGRVGVSKAALAYYERGERVPDASVLAAYREVLGINISWLVTGAGSMFDDPTKAPPPSVAVDPQLLRRLHRAARLAYKDIGHLVPDEDGIAVEAGKLYNALLQEVSDIRQERIVDAVIPVLVEDLKARLREASAEPGTGKRSA